jgi:Ras-related protein Rab-1A
MMSEEYDYLFKSIVVGDGGVGKTALTLRFSKGIFQEKYKMTIGVDFHVKTIDVQTDNGVVKTKLQIWDTGGQERFASIRPMYYRGALGALIIFDLTSSPSFEHLPQWIEEVRANAKEEIPLLLVGNKDDLVEQRQVSLEEINEFTDDFNLYYMETSAKTGDNVGDCFHILACLMIGEGVPEKLIEEGNIYAPGKIPISKKEETLVPPEEVEAVEYEAPPEPTPEPAVEPEMEYEAPPEPTPEPAVEPEMEYEAPPEPTPEPAVEPEMEYEAPSEPTPEPAVEKTPSEFEFKTPEEVLAEQENIPQEETEVIPPSELSKPPQQEEYKPKGVPFSSKSPQPTQPPQEFVSEQSTVASESTSPGYQQPSKKKSSSLYDYFPPSLEEEKEPEEEPEEEPEVQTPSLFETLSRRKATKKEKKGYAFNAFISSTPEASLEGKESEVEAIPNIEDIESTSSTEQTGETTTTKKKRGGVVICPNCGATLSNDYMFCNKCGTKLD